MIKTQKYEIDKQITIGDFLSFSAVIGNTGISTGPDGRKIIPAGTPVGGKTDFLLNRQTVLKATNSPTDGADSQGVVLHDIDVTDGNNSVAVVVTGCVDVLKVEVTYDSAALTQLKGLGVKFAKGAK